MGRIGEYDRMTEWTGYTGWEKFGVWARDAGLPRKSVCATKRNLNTDYTDSRR